MRGVAALVAVLAGLTVPAAAGAPPKPVPPVTLPPGGSATATAMPATAGARSVRLTLTVRFEMQCGRPGAGPVVVSLPAAERVPHTIARRDVSLGGKPPLRASISGHVVVLTLPPQRGVICDVIGPGTLTVGFAPAVGLGNPPTGGSYPVAVRVGARAFVAHLAVTG
ncbi:MAG TPA: hypothetical protein VEH55_02060 [Gaiellaceae bacterium]|nr:hypothetical protein [Gaiellaceae bacterium]